MSKFHTRASSVIQSSAPQSALNGWTSGIGDDVGVEAGRVLFIEKDEESMAVIAIDDDGLPALDFVGGEGRDSKHYPLNGSSLAHMKAETALSKAGYGLKKLPDMRWMLWLATGK